MGFLKTLASLFSPGEGGGDPHGVHFYVRCDNCGTIVHVRADRRNDLSREEGGQGDLLWRKEIMDDRCFRMMRAEVWFDSHHNIVSQEVQGGEFVSREDFEKQRSERQVS